MGLLVNLKNRGFKDILNPKKWAIFARFITRKATGLHLDDNEIQAYCEQVIYRMDLCRPCAEKGECTHCGCKAPELFFDKENVCSAGSWGEMLSPKDWGVFTDATGLNLTAMYNQQQKNKQ